MKFYKQNESIGGYFGLELNKYEEYHKNAIALNSGRNCLEYILRVRNYRKVYIPYYSCDVILEPLIKLNIQYDFYNINKELDPPEINLKDNEALLYTNYFGIKSNTVNKLSGKYKNLIIDNSQAFFDKPINGIDTYYSPRKFFGVPDGGYLYIDKILNEEFETDISFNRFRHLLKRIDVGAEKSYNDYKLNEKSLSGQEIKFMSNLTKSLLKNIDYNKVKTIRLSNFNYIHNKLEKINGLQISLNKNYYPMVYPFLIKNGNEIKKKLISNKIYIATYWPNVLKHVKKDYFEYYLAYNLIPIPIDQRYNKVEINNIIKFIK